MKFKSQIWNIEKNVPALKNHRNDPMKVVTTSSSKRNLIEFTFKYDRLQNAIHSRPKLT